MSEKSRIFVGSVVDKETKSKVVPNNGGKLFQSALASTTSNVKKKYATTSNLRFGKLRGVSKQTSRITITANKIRNQAKSQISPWTRVRDYLTDNKSPLTTKQKLEQRKQRFATKKTTESLLSEEKKQERAKRFAITNTTTTTSTVTKDFQLLSPEERRELRKQRFANTSQEELKKEQRQKRFSEHLSSKNNLSSDTERLEQRKHRFNNEAKNRQAAQTIFSFLGNSSNSKQNNSSIK